MSNETELKDFVKREAAATRKGATLLLVVGIVIACAIAGWLSYVLNFLQTNYQAKDIIDVVYDQVETAVHGLVPKVEPYVLANAPGLMDEAKKRIVENAPKLRAQAEGYLAILADNLSSRAHDAVSKEVRDVMQTHGPQVREALDAAGDVQKSALAERHLQEALESEFEQTAVTHLDPYLPELLRVLKETDEHMKLFVEAAPEKLTEEQRLEREFVTILNTLFERGFSRMRGS